MTRKHRHNHAVRGVNSNITQIAEVKTILPADGSAVELPLPEGISAFISEDGKLMFQKKSNDPDNAPQNFGITYEEIAEKLFLDKEVYFFNGYEPELCLCDSLETAKEEDNARSVEQVLRQIAFNKLLNIAIYLNGSWKPAFGDYTNEAYTIGYDKEGKIAPVACYSFNVGLVLFPSKYICEQAIRIMGEKSIHDLLSYEY